MRHRAGSPNSVSPRPHVAPVARALLLAALAAAPIEALPADVLTSIGGVPAHVASLFESPAAFQQGPDGGYYVFDRGGHAVYRLEANRSAARRIIGIGQETGRIIDPTGFDVAATFALNESRAAEDEVGGPVDGGRPARRPLSVSLNVSVASGSSGWR